jgi:REP element-mobilizing transposase RayT
VGRDNRAVDPESIYHVTCRGSNRGRIVWDDYDCEAFRKELFRVAAAFEWEVFAWCLMPNHHHVVLRTHKQRFSDGFQQLNGNHSRRTNRRHGRTDHLFRNRPRSTELASTAHLITGIAYVFRNPLDAGLVEHAAAWRWSSYRATLDFEPAPAWLLVDEVLELFGNQPRAARRALERLVHFGHLPVSDTEEMPDPLMT